MGAMSLWHWGILLLVAILVFGTGKLKNIGKDAGSAIRGFKEGLNDSTEQTPKDEHKLADPATDHRS
ncbi:MAG TPA: twin-arginine translocase subunit TatA [Succinivibrionaceae bacterium]|nr:twin-arginine translocase subunit TatA [Succinivibrionaceae bacterium]